MGLPAEVRAVDWAFRLKRALTNNSGDNAFTALSPTTTKPSGSGVYEFNTQYKSATPRYLFLIPLAVGNDNVTGSVRVTGWRALEPATAGAAPVWVPFTLAELAFTASARTGVSGNTDLPATERLADTITITTGNANVDVTVVSTTNDTVAHALVDLKGAQVVQIEANDGGSATSANALFAVL